MILHCLGRPNVITRVLIREKQEIRVVDVAMEAEVGVIPGRGHEPRSESSFLKLEKARKQILP